MHVYYLDWIGLSEWWNAGTGDFMTTTTTITNYRLLSVYPCCVYTREIAGPVGLSGEGGYLTGLSQIGIFLVLRWMV